MTGFDDLGDHIRLWEGDCRTMLDQLPDASIDACVTDPPYEISYDDNHWDHTGIAHDPTLWRRIRRVLKPGGHVCAFSATRTYHRLACAMEDAGLEIRDQIDWVYATGQPRGSDIGTLTRTKRADMGEVMAVCHAIREGMDDTGTTSRQLAPLFGVTPRMVEHWAARTPASQPAIPSMERWRILKDRLGLDDAMDATVERLNQLKHPKPGPATPESERWNGWNTALKPAHEPICVARRPCDGPVADNMRTHGVGAFHTSACATGGRFPPNMAVSDAVGDMLAGMSVDAANVFPVFRYEPKPSTGERPTAGGVTHPTVKPVPLMAWLIRLVTPRGGMVLDPFAGSGSTLEACVMEGRGCAAAELDPDYRRLIRQRLARPISRTLL